MTMGKAKYPSPPDPYATASAQGAANKDTAIAQARLNMVDQVGPNGSLTYQAIPGSASGGGTQRYRAITRLSPRQQGLANKENLIQHRLLNVGQQQLGRLNNSLAKPFSMSGLPERQDQISSSIADPGAVSDVASPAAMAKGFADVGDVQREVDPDGFSQDRQRVEAALMQRMQPYLDQREQSARSRLVNMGFEDAGSQGYQSEMDEVYRAENDARLAAIASAGDEQARLFGMDMAAGQFANNAQQQAFDQSAFRTGFANNASQADFQNDLAEAGFNNQATAQRFGQNTAQLQAETASAEFANRARQNALQEMMLERQTPLNEIAALTSGAQVQMPQFAATPQTGIAAPDLQGAIYNNYNSQVQQANQRAQAQQGMMRNIFGLAGSAFGAFG